MSKSNSTSNATISSSSIGLTLLTITLVILKALGYIDWPWWMVFLPTIFSIGVGLLIIIGAVVLVWWVESRRW